MRLHIYISLDIKPLPAHVYLTSNCLIRLASWAFSLSFCLFFCSFFSWSTTDFLFRSSSFKALILPSISLWSEVVSERDAKSLHLRIKLTQQLLMKSNEVILHFYKVSLTFKIKKFKCLKKYLFVICVIHFP